LRIRFFVVISSSSAMARFLLAAPLNYS
jgi:hypothetical protein